MLAVTLGVETVPAASTYYMDAGGRFVPDGKSLILCMSENTIDLWRFERYICWQ